MLTLDDTLAAPTEGQTHDQGERTKGLGRGGAIGRYLVLDRLGAGGMGVVYEAFDPELERKLAVKLLRSPSDDTETAALAAARMLREAQAMAKVAHPNAVAVHDVGTWRDQIFIAMELIDGQTLRHWLEGAHDWREILAVLVQAGRGLAAVHEQGLVHRDFKPDNIMVGADGRVRVMDFGLARGVVREGSGARVYDHDLASHSGDNTVRSGTDERLTREGALVGTPAYMSPEQISRHESDARSDQFSFCVVAFEALCGERPFRGATFFEMSSAVLEGAVSKEPLARARVPRRVKAAIRRGLSVGSDQRWPDMSALLDELELDPFAARRWGMLAVGGLVLVALGAFAFGGPEPQTSGLSLCEDRSTQLGEVWGAEQAGAIRAAFEATKLGYAPELATRAVTTLDAYAEALFAARRDACKGSDGLAEALRVQQAVCLQRGAATLQGLAEGLASVDVAGVDRSVRALTTLPELDRCSDALWLGDELRPPEDPESAAQLEALQLRLETVAAKAELGRHREALEPALEVLVDARALGEGPMLATALHRVGVIRERLGEYEDAVPLLVEAHAEASAAGRPGLAVTIAASLTYLLGSQLDRTAEAKLIADVAAGQLRDHVRRRGEDPLLEAQLLTDRAAVELAAGDAAAATASWEKSLALRESRLAPDHPVIGNTHYNIGVGYYSQDDSDQAGAHWRSSLTMRRAAYGDRHPYVADSIDAVAIVTKQGGELERALELYLEALDIRTELLGPEHPDLAISLTNIGMAQTAAGQHREARESLERAKAILEAAHGPDYMNLAYPLDALADLSKAEGQLERAIEERRQALALVVAKVGEEHPRARELAGAIAKDELALASREG